MIILASSSPRRKEILELTGFKFKVIPSSFDEESIHVQDCNLLPYELSYYKAIDVLKDYPHDTIIGSDTIVVIDNEVLGKPRSKEEAKTMLQKLSNKTHEVITGVCILKKEQIIRFTSITHVTFTYLSPKEIQAYVDTNEPMDKAGAYAIQGLGGKYISKIDGDFYTVMGLPLYRVYHELKQLGE